MKLSKSFECKSVCVIDTCSLLYAAQIQLKNHKIFDWILDRYQVYICPKVKTECINNIQKGHVVLDDPENFKRIVTEHLFKYDFQECLTYLDEYCSKKEIFKFQKVQEGERQSLALALFLSINLREPVILLTDDLDALEVFNTILGQQKFGIAKALPDFIVTLFQSTESLEDYVAGRAFQNYYSIATRADLRKSMFGDRMKLSCRILWFQNCNLRCL